jgi:lipoprotein-releasing system ATP-binding protein
MVARSNSVLDVRNLTKEYPAPGGPLRVLSDVNLTLKVGDSVSIVGPSGSGKSTLLYILGALEPPTSGTVRLAGQNPYDLDDTALAMFRNLRVGFVFQEHHLLPQCSVLENVLIPTLLARDTDGSPELRARELLDAVGLGPRMHYRPHQLSGGEKQRAALARALVRRPQLVLCDEPTGNLDHESAESVMSLLLALHATQPTILVVVTHNLDFAGRFGTRLRIRDAHLDEVP